jgi:hypothetical protein
MPDDKFVCMLIPYIIQHLMNLATGMPGWQD